MGGGAVAHFSKLTYQYVALLLALEPAWRAVQNSAVLEALFESGHYYVPRPILMWRGEGQKGVESPALTQREKLKGRGVFAAWAFGVWVEIGVSGVGEKLKGRGVFAPG